VSRLTFTDDEWRAAWHTLRKQIEADTLEDLERASDGLLETRHRE